MKVWTKLLGNSGGEVPSPVGALMDYIDDVDPDANWMVCDGRTLDSVADTTLAALYARIGTKYGGTGASSFNLPDARGRMTVAKGTHTEVNALGKSDGLAVGSRKVKHQHGKGNLSTVLGGTHRHNANEAMTAMLGPSGNLSTFLNTSNNANYGAYHAPNTAEAVHSHPNSEFTGSVGDTTGPVDGPGYLVTNKIIRVR